MKDRQRSCWLLIVVVSNLIILSIVVLLACGTEKALTSNPTEKTLESWLKTNDEFKQSFKMITEPLQKSKEIVAGSAPAAAEEIAKGIEDGVVQMRGALSTAPNGAFEEVMHRFLDDAYLLSLHIYQGVDNGAIDLTTEEQIFTQYIATVEILSEAGALLEAMHINLD